MLSSLKFILMTQQLDAWVGSICWSEVSSVLVSVDTMERRGQSVAKIHSSGRLMKNHQVSVRHIILLGKVERHETEKTSSSASRIGCVH